MGSLGDPKTDSAPVLVFEETNEKTNMFINKMGLLDSGQI